ncbi:MAG: imidazolonepropionase, partial [Chloroflexi bacterium]|nr:imidazolonepropionase [Chloroflexota bacterium]
SPGALAWEDGIITYAGPAEGSPVSEAAVPGAVVPGFVDCHTHLPFFGWREDEFAARLAGRSYRDLHGEGGISRSARMLTEASDEEILEFCRPLVAEMAAHGTTALEMKTGYGLSIEAELRQARLARRLAAQVPQTCTVTLLACHAVPPDASRADWVRQVCDELIPTAAAEGLVDAVDIYVEDIAFTLDDLGAVAEAAAAAGLPLRCHADQLGPSGAGSAAVEAGARSADHLNNLSEAGVGALGSAAATVAVLLPASTLMLRAGLPPVTELVEAGAAIALSTDFNPGTSPVLSMPEVIGLGCSLYGLQAEAALIAATVNPAWVLGLDRDLGTLEVGKRADFLVLDAADIAAVPYRPGHNPVAATYIGGALVASQV